MNLNKKGRKENVSSVFPLQYLWRTEVHEQYLQLI